MGNVIDYVETSCVDGIRNTPTHKEPKAQDHARMVNDNSTVIASMHYIYTIFVKRKPGCNVSWTSTAARVREEGSVDNEYRTWNSAQDYHQPHMSMSGAQMISQSRRIPYSKPGAETDEPAHHHPSVCVGVGVGSTNIYYIFLPVFRVPAFLVERRSYVHPWARVRGVFPFVKERKPPRTRTRTRTRTKMAGLRSRSCPTRPIVDGSSWCSVPGSCENVRNPLTHTRTHARTHEKKESVCAFVISKCVYVYASYCGLEG